jgi:hypothetical protein
MEIYIGNIPKGTRAAEIRKLIKNAIKDNVFQRLFDQLLNRGHFDDGVNVNIVKYDSSNGADRYGHVVIQSGALARLTLEALNEWEETQIRGSDLEIRRYVTRRAQNDRRDPSWREKPWKGKCRRVADRRRND